MAGCLPGLSGEPLRQALRAQAASGAYGVISSLAAGPATIVSTADSCCDDFSGTNTEARVTLSLGASDLCTYVVFFLFARFLAVLNLTYVIYFPPTDQLKLLHVSRALCHLDQPVVLLTRPADGMSEAQEKLFFGFLREQLRPGQVVVLTTAREGTAALADLVLHLDPYGDLT